MTLSYLTVDEPSLCSRKMLPLQYHAWRVAKDVLCVSCMGRRRHPASVLPPWLTCSDDSLQATLPNPVFGRTVKPPFDVWPTTSVSVAQANLAEPTLTYQPYPKLARQQSSNNLLIPRYAKLHTVMLSSSSLHAPSVTQMRIEGL